MPILTLTANVSIPDERSFLKELAAFGAKTLSKPEEYIMVNHTYNPNLIFSGSFDPAYTLHIINLGNLSPELNEGYSKAFAAFFDEKLDVKNDRGYIMFKDPGMAYMGYKGTTFEAMFKK